MANRNISTKTTAERLAGLLNTFFAKKTDIPAVSVVEKGTPNTGYLKSYQVTVGGTAVGVDIDIPKDFLVKSATSSVVTEEDKASGGKFENDDSYAVGDAYLDFVINVKSGTAADAHVYVNVSNLVDVYHNGNGLDLDSATNTFSLKLDTANANGLAVDGAGLKLTLASASANGAMSSDDFTKLKGISAGANKVEASETNGNMKIDGEETKVYELPSSVLQEDDLSDYTEAELRTLLGLPASE